MEFCCYLRNVQDLQADGKTPYERRFGESLKGPFFHSVHQWNLSQTARDSENSSIRTESITRNFSRLCFDRGVIAEIEELEKLDASEI